MLGKNIRYMNLEIDKIYEFKIGNPSHKKHDYIKGTVLKNYKNHILIERKGKIGNFKECISKVDLYCSYAVAKLIGGIE